MTRWPSIVACAFLAGGGLAQQTETEREPTQRERNLASFDAALTALRERYSYRDLHGVDWDERAAEHRDAVAGARSDAVWVRRMQRFLGAAKDSHLWLQQGKGPLMPTYARRRTPNFELAALRKTMPGIERRNDVLLAGRTDDDIGYLLVGTLRDQTARQLREAQDILDELRDCKALVLDLRANGGGNELLARPIAQWFVEGIRVYAQHVTRDPAAEGGFTEPYLRKIVGNRDPKRFRGPVAVLIGQGAVSSGEAFVLMMRQAERATLIGDRTAGSSGNPKPHAMPNDITLWLPSWRAMDADGACFEGKGVAPDVAVETKRADFEAGDPVLARGLALLREKIAR